MSLKTNLSYLILGASLFLISSCKTDESRSHIFEDPFQKKYDLNQDGQLDSFEIDYIRTHNLKNSLNSRGEGYLEKRCKYRK